jgi:hypothetical protein
MSLRQYSRSCRSDIDSTMYNASKFDIIKLINSFINTIGSKTTLLPCLYKTIDVELLPELLQKSARVVCSRHTSSDAGSRALLPSIDVPE